MTRRFRCTYLAALFAVGPWVSSAEAAPTVPTSVDHPLDETLSGPAKDAYGSAKILFNNGDFVGAATKYGQAYELSKDPRLLFNLAVCEKNVRHYARTQLLLQQYEREMGVRMAPDDKATVEAALGAIRNLVGRVALSANEAGASVLVDGQPVGTTPLDGPLLLDLGKHALKVNKSGFVSSDQSVEVAGGNETTVTVTLAAEVHVAQILVVAEPDATIVIDGKTVAKEHFEGRVAPGAHVVRVSRPGKIAYKADVDLKDGETRSVSVTLESEKHAPLWPWLVGGAAVVVAGAAVGGYFLFKPQPQSTPAPPDQLGSLQLGTAAFRR